MQMKKIFIIIVLSTLVLGTVFAQKKQPTGMRVEVAESETDHGDYSIFTYVDDDDTFGYYLSLARTSDFLGADEILGMQVKNIREVAIWLGATSTEAMETIGDILDLFDKDLGTTAEFRSRATMGSARLSDYINTNCVVEKKPLGGKRLQFFFPSGKKQAYAYLTKSVLKELRMNFKFDLKLHPKQHRK